jgi:hypothetical protein
MTHPDSTTSDALRLLLDAFDAQCPERLQAVSRRPRVGPFFGALDGLALDDLDVALVVASLVARLAGSSGATGRELAALVAEDSATRLTALGHLSAESRLVQNGVLIPEVVPAHAAEAETMTYRLGEQIFRLACGSLGTPVAPRPSGPVDAYASNIAVLGDLRKLSLHYRRRAARIFHLDPWSGTGIEVLDGTTEVVQRARLETSRVLKRLRRTPDDAGFAVLELKREQHLNLDALVILATVLFQELLEGVGAVDAVDLVKLISQNEAELIAKRKTLRPLASAGLLRLEGAYGDKELTADASLPNEVVDSLLGQHDSIGSDQKIDFHAYLQRLDSSEAFFSDLDDGSFGS